MLINSDQDLARIYDTFSKKTKHAFHIIHHLCLKYNTTYVSHAKIAKIAKCHVKTVTRAVEVLNAFGFINSTYRHMKTSIYTLTEFTKCSMIKEKLSAGRLKNRCEKPAGFGNVPQNVPQYKLSNNSIETIYNIDTIPEIPSHLKNLKSLRKNKPKFICDLAAIPRHVYDTVLKRIKNGNYRGINDVYSYLFKACLNMCKENKIKPIWPNKYKLLKRLDIVMTC